MGLEQLGDAHQHVVDAPAEVACRGTHEHADQDAQRGSHHADRERDARAVRNAGDHVAAERIAAERIGGVLPGPQQWRRHHVERIAWVEQRREQRQHRA
jgi:hypothetical protein